MPTINVYLDQEANKKVEELSKIKKIAKTDLINEAIKSYLKDGDQNNP